LVRAVQYSAGTPARSNRARLLVQLSGRNSRNGVANGASALDGKISLHRGIIQVAGEAATMRPDTLRKLATEFEPLHAVLIRHEQVVLAQAQSAGCNASHKVEARMCRWLLRIRDLTRSNDLTLTQEFLAQMLGVRRSSVSVVAGTLQSAATSASWTSSNWSILSSRLAHLRAKKRHLRHVRRS
jgi:hypothetical protein